MTMDTAVSFPRVNEVGSGLANVNCKTCFLNRICLKEMLAKLCISPVEKKTRFGTVNKNRSEHTNTETDRNLVFHGSSSSHVITFHSYYSADMLHPTFQVSFQKPL